MRKMAVNGAHGSGVGRHSKEDVRHFGFGDLEAISVMLGSQDYFFGQEPTVLDCSVFGLMCMLLYTSGEDNIYVQKIEQEWPNRPPA